MHGKINVFWSGREYRFNVLDSNGEQIDYGRVRDVAGFEDCNEAEVTRETLLNVIEALGREWSFQVARDQIELVGDFIPHAAWEERNKAMSDLECAKAIANHLGIKGKRGGWLYFRDGKPMVQGWFSAMVAWKKKGWIFERNGTCRVDWAKVPQYWERFNF